MKTLKSHSPRTLSLPLLGGLLGGTSMIVLNLVFAFLVGRDFWLPLELLGAGVIRADALSENSIPLLTGLSIHLALATVFGIVFALLLPQESTNSQNFMGGIIFGVALWAFMTYFALPSANPSLVDRAALMRQAWLLPHLAYGVCLGFLPAIFDRTSSGH